MNLATAMDMISTATTPDLPPLMFLCGRCGQTEAYNLGWKNDKSPEETFCTALCAEEDRRMQVRMAMKEDARRIAEAADGKMVPLGAGRAIGLCECKGWGGSFQDIISTGHHRACPKHPKQMEEEAARQRGESPRPDNICGVPIIWVKSLDEEVKADAQPR